MDLKKDDLEDQRKLEKILEDYSKLTNQGYTECSSLSKQILSKWNRIKFDIQTTYQNNGEDGAHERGWEQLKRQLNDERAPKEE